MKHHRTGARLPIYLKEVLDHFELTDCHLLGVTTDNPSSKYSIGRELQSTLEASGIQWTGLRCHIACMAHFIWLALGAVLSSLGENGRTKSWEAHERNQQFGENENKDIGKSQRLRQEGNGRINKVSAMGPGLAKIIGRLLNSKYFEYLETDHQIVENACCIDYAATWLSKRIHWMSNSSNVNNSTTYYGCEETVEFDAEVAWTYILLIRVDPQVAQKFKLLWLPATLYNTRWMDHWQV